MNIAKLLLTASGLAAAPALAADDQVLRGPAPKWAVESEPMPVPEDASGMVFVRRTDSLIHLDAKGQEQYLGYRIKVLHPSALQLGNLSFSWNPAAGAPTVHAIKVHRDGAAIDVLDKAKFEILRREDQLEQAYLDGVLTATMRIADLRVGDELEVSFTTRTSDPTLGAEDAGFLFLSPEPPHGRFRLGLSWEEGQEPHLKIPDAMASAAGRDERAINFRFDNPAMLALPKDAPPRYNWQRVVEYSDFDAWEAISRHFAPLYVKASTLADGSPLKAEARRIAEAHADPLERATAALKLVQQQVRYVYVGLDGGNLKPADAEESWQRRYGDCKGKTALLLALLRELDVEAEAVLVNNTGLDDGLDARLPNPGLFDHVLVRARIAGADYWLDGTLPPVARPTSTPIVGYRWVLPLATRGAALQQLAWEPAKQPDEITLYEIDAREGFDEPARIVSTNIVRGMRGLEQQAQFSALAPAQLVSSMRQHLVGDVWQEIEDVQWRYDSKALASILTITGKGTVNWDDDGDGAKSLSLPGGGFSPPERRVRAADQDQKAPFYRTPSFSCHVTSVRLPASTDPKLWWFNTQFDTRLFGQNYYRAFDMREGAIHMIRGSRIEQIEVDPASAERDNGRISTFDNSMAWIHYEPSGHDESVRPSKVRVPATYDYDWTADEVPCLMTMAKR